MCDCIASIDSEKVTPVEQPTEKEQEQEKKVAEQQEEKEEDTDMPDTEKLRSKRTRARKPKRKGTTRANSLWIRALKNLGYFAKGGKFQALPKKGSDAYHAVVREMRKLEGKSE